MTILSKDPSVKAAARTILTRTFPAMTARVQTGSILLTETIRSVTAIISLTETVRIRSEMVTATGSLMEITEVTIQKVNNKESTSKKRSCLKEAAPLLLFSNCLHRKTILHI